MKVVTVLIAYHFSLVISPAQTFTQRVQQHASGEGTVTIHQDKSIEQLVNGMSGIPVQTKNNTTDNAKKDKPAQTSSGKHTTSGDKTQQHATSGDKSQQHDKTQSTAQNTTSGTQTESGDTASAATAIPKHQYRTTGFRVQAFAGGNTRRDRQKAEQTGNAMRQLFPGTEVYVHFYSPRWVCRVGNYRTFEEAREVMLSIRKLGYESATVVKGKIVVSQP